MTSKTRVSSRTPKEWPRVERTFHDVVTIRDEANADGEGNHRNLPQGNRRLSRRGGRSRPGRIHDRPDTDRVADVVGTVGKGRRAGRDDLDEGIQIFRLVGVLGRVRVDAVHAMTFGSAQHTDLGLVDVVVHAVEEGHDRIRRQALAESLHVVSFID